jgi:hypothetical protein
MELFPWLQPTSAPKAINATVHAAKNRFILTPHLQTKELRHCSIHSKGKLRYGAPVWVEMHKQPLALTAKPSGPGSARRRS